MASTMCAVPAMVVMLMAPLIGQERPSMLGSSYVLPSPVTVAPGQLVTVIMEGVETGDYPIIKAPAGEDLPTSLVGLSVNFWQGTSRPVPILEIHQFCANSLAFPWNWRPYCAPLSAVTIQIPFDAKSLLPVPAPGEGGIFAGQLSAGGFALSVVPHSDQVHILTACDAFLRNGTVGPVSPTGLPCSSIVTHADGSTVSAANPASEGETLVIYAVGLGQTNPPSATGKLVTESAPTQTKFTLDYNYRPNALPSRPLPAGPQPLYAGTTPGYVGLYQINVLVPPVPDGTPACVDTSNLPRGSNVVESNLTVSVGGLYSFDGARICVAVPNP